MGHHAVGIGMKDPEERILQKSLEIAHNGRLPRRCGR
jgi:hypothetical protein